MKHSEQQVRTSVRDGACCCGGDGGDGAAAKVDCGS